MSLLGNLINSLTGKNNVDFTPPCSLCPGSCGIGPGACAECQPYKERLKDALYNVDHLDEFNARYEVVGTVSSGSTTCPHCGAPSGNRFVCDYCGMQIAEDDGKIRVTSANDIPDPVIEARDIIYERHSKIVSKYNSKSSDGLLSGILDHLDGDSSDGLGQRMSKEEITEAAALYGVTVSSYLNGLDNGVYKTLSEKKKADTVGSVAGIGGATILGGTMGHSQGHMPPPQKGRRPERPPQPTAPRPEGRREQINPVHKPGQGTPSSRRKPGEVQRPGPSQHGGKGHGRI